tara:strand:+ start:469 stop:936 length:468 start_codon:yes stop_codon:yes gene_type:complete
MRAWAAPMNTALANITRRTIFLVGQFDVARHVVTSSWASGTDFIVLNKSITTWTNVAFGINGCTAVLYGLVQTILTSCINGDKFGSWRTIQTLGAFAVLYIFAQWTIGASGGGRIVTGLNLSFLTGQTCDTVGRQQVTEERHKERKIKNPLVSPR